MRISATEAKRKFGITKHWLRMRNLSGVDIGYEKVGRQTFYDFEKIAAVLYLDLKQIAKKYDIAYEWAWQKMRYSEHVVINRIFYYTRDVVEAAFLGFSKRGSDNPDKERRWDCLRYEKCLSNAAIQGVGLECGCPEYQKGGGLAL